MHGWNPLDWSAGAYLAFHAAAFVAALVLGKALQSAFIPDGRPGRLNDEEHARLEELRRRLGGVRPASVADVVRQALEALEYRLPFMDEGP